MGTQNNPMERSQKKPEEVKNTGVIWSNRKFTFWMDMVMNDKIIFIEDWYDGPISGYAHYDNALCYFASDQATYTGYDPEQVYYVWFITDEILKMALEQFEHFLYWRDKHRADILHGFHYRRARQRLSPEEIAAQYVDCTASELANMETDYKNSLYIKAFLSGKEKIPVTAKFHGNADHSILYPEAYVKWTIWANE